MNEFQIGDRVQVTDTRGWPTAPIGTVTWGPGKTMTWRNGTTGTAYVVTFDSPQPDNSDDGPYIAAEIFSNQLKKIEESFARRVTLDR